MSTLKSLYHFQNVAVTDSLVNGDPKKLRRFAELLVKRDLDLEWSASIRADVDDGMAELLYRAGLRHAFIGVEPFDDRTLELRRKSRMGSDNPRAGRAVLSPGVGAT